MSMSRTSRSEKAKERARPPTRNDDITQPEHRKLHTLGRRHKQPLPSNLPHIPRKNNLDRRIKALGHGHHDRRKKHPKHVVEKQTGKEDDTGHERVERQQLDCGCGEGEAVDVGEQPVFVHDVDDGEDG